MAFGHHYVFHIYDYRFHKHLLITHLNKPNLFMSTDRFSRWQTILREQLSFTINLLLTISIATIGFLFSVLNNSSFNPVHCQKLFFTIGLIFVFLSVIFGLVVSCIRLYDFRITLKKINIQRKQQQNQIDNTEDLGNRMKLIGNTTWIFFYLQIGTLCFGYINLGISFYLLFNDKLF